MGKLIIRLLLALVAVLAIVNLVVNGHRDRPRFVPVAGGKGVGYGGDGGLAVDAGLNSPAGIAVDFAGNLFIADSSNRAVRKVDARGIITTVARNGAFGYQNSTRHRDAGKCGPFELACGLDGKVYLADTLFHRVCVLEATGRVRVVAGIGVAGYSGDGGLATKAKLNGPGGICVCPNGDLLIADKGNFRVRRVDRAGIITTVGGNGSSGMTNVHRDALGHVSGEPPDTKHNGDGGPATSAFVEPWLIAVDGRGNMFVDEALRIRRIDAKGTISTVVGGGAGRAADGVLAREVSMDMIGGMAVDPQGNLFLATVPSGPVYRVSNDGLMNVYAANPPSPLGGFRPYPPARGDSSVQPFVFPSGLAVDGKGRVYVSDSGTCQVLRIDK